MISIIIPILNDESDIQRCFDSLIHQTIGFANLEIILVDVNSTDLIQTFSNKYGNVKSISLKENSFSKANPKNIGMDYATKDYIMFLDVNDILSEDSCKVLYDEITYENADLLSGTLSYDGLNPFWESISSNSKSNTNNLPLKITSIEECPSIILDYNFKTKIYRRAFLEENSINFSEEITGESIFLFNVFLNANGIKYIDKIVYKSSNNENNLSINLKNMLDSFFKMYHISLDKDKSDIFKNHLLFYKLNNFLRCLINSNLSVSDVLDLLIYSSPLFRLNNKYEGNFVPLFEYISNKDYENALRFIYGEDTLNQNDIKIVSNMEILKEECYFIELKNDYLNFKEDLDLFLNKLNDKKPHLFIFKYEENYLNDCLDTILAYCRENNVPSVCIGYSSNKEPDFDYFISDDINKFNSKNNKVILTQILDKIGFKYIPYLKHIVLFYELNSLRDINKIHNHFYSLNYPFKHLKLIAVEENLFLSNTILKSDLENIDFGDNYYFTFADLNLKSTYLKNELSKSNHNFSNKIKNMIFSSSDFKRGLSNYLQPYNPKISVIVPVYNVESYLEETLNSILNQSFIDDIEVLMIDDGSTDNSPNIIDRYADNYENFHAFHKENGGASTARNYGLDIAQGEYVHFMDSDDFIPHYAYERLYDFAIDGDYDVVTTNYLRFNSKNLSTVSISEFLFKPYESPVLNTNMYEFADLSWDTPNCNKIIKREFLKENNIRYYHKNLLYEDNPFMIQVYTKAKKVALLNDVNYYWRIREIGTSTTQSFDLEMGNKLFEMVDWVNGYITQNIDDKGLLLMKYSKLVKVDLFNYLNSIKSLESKENQEYMFESAYDMVSLIPNEIVYDLPLYYRTLCEMIKNRDIYEALSFGSWGFKSNPIVPKDFKAEYLDIIDLKEYSRSERLYSYATNIICEENSMVIDFRNKINFYPDADFDETYFKLVNKQYDDIKLDSDYIKNGKLYLPLDLIESGDNFIETNIRYDETEKEAFMRTGIDKRFSFDDFDIVVQKDKFNSLRFIKREKNSMELIIDDIQLNEDFLQFKGHSNGKLSNILLKEIFDIAEFEYPVVYKEEVNEINLEKDKETDFADTNEFNFNLNLKDLFKSPMKQWELTSKDNFKSISLKEEYEFSADNYKISIKNSDNIVRIALI